MDAQILYQDEHIVAVNKPPGVPVHRSREHRDAGQPLLQIVRDTVGMHVYPIHRLDRAASGVIVFALSSEGAAALQETMQRPTTEKHYLAMVRGLAPEYADVCRTLTDKKSGIVKEAHSEVWRQEAFPAGGAFGTVSLVRVRIHTGRRHQIRRHLSHLRNQILGDTTYGKGAINRHAREWLGLPRMFLHAAQLIFAHPESGVRLEITAPLWPDLAAALERARTPHPQPPDHQEQEPPPTDG